ncbi:alkylation response protein AidB-like acyl-CoA dehydrogenase [Microbacterium testaceum]|uniref:acyl-CoA dehydrogenase family protein n=1 Tax=Microbacterium TaxID=33882 RepID=UPI0027893CE2|nr:MULTISPECIES: acyl-CoA dehydrogenase family protein [Microbacterium]MDQ1112049.1 alkylation response protein AidB-like acyl-CoA dehydrogenase [Microbacterium testaceum]MDR6097417.1 alkylation response protein AidB-like acyl-CoA dehydrogenase [Microbacterium sp. SORGH_AS_0454]
MTTTDSATTDLADRWRDAPAPHDSAGWIARAREVADIFAADAVERDRANQPPFTEVALLKASGLVTLLGPREHGGAGETWETAYKVIRAVARGDGSIGQLLGYHYLWAWAARLVATDAQIAAVEALYTSNAFLFGGAVNPRDSDLVIREDGGDLIFSGHKSFSTGGRVSDLTVLEGVLEGTDTHIFAIVPTAQEGIVFAGDWDNLGQRLTESGSVEIRDVRVPWADAAGFVDKQFQPLVYNTLNVPAIQLVFANFYLGIAQGAHETAAAYTRDRTRPWPYGGDDKQRATDEWYLLEGYGTLQSKLWADEALLDAVGAEISAVLHAPREELTEHRRGEIAVRIAAGKLRIVDDGLEVASKVYELTGARATSNAVGLDIFWRNLRTHSLHDPIAYKKREVGEYVLLYQVPVPTWYT